VRNLADDLRKKPRPVLLECITFRMRGHEEASGTKYVPKKLMDEWAKKDPLSNYEEYLLKEKVIDKKFVEETRKKIKKEIDAGLEVAFKENLPAADTATEVADVYAPFNGGVVEPASEKKTEKRFIDAIRDGLYQSMERHQNLVLMGPDI